MRDVSMWLTMLVGFAVSSQDHVLGSSWGSSAGAVGKAESAARKQDEQAGGGSTGRQPSGGGRRRRPKVCCTAACALLTSSVDCAGFGVRYNARLQSKLLAPSVHEVHLSACMDTRAAQSGDACTGS